MNTRNTPLCPMLIQGAMSADSSWAPDFTKPITWAECMGSRCAWWSVYPDDRTKGRCDKARNTEPWPDPAPKKEPTP